MLFRVVYEDEVTADMRRKIKSLNNKQLTFLEEAIKREKRKRKQNVFNEWMECLNQIERDK